jgi:putative DNA primase/helicase
VNRSGKGITSSTEYNKTIGETTNEDEASHVEAEYFILPDVFQKEICKGHDYKKVAKLYVELGVIIPETHGGKLHSATRNERLPTLGSTRCYKIAPDFMKLTQPIVTTGAGN